MLLPIHFLMILVKHIRILLKFGRVYFLINTFAAMTKQHTAALLFMPENARKFTCS
jgi:hypothetical protein